MNNLLVSTETEGTKDPKNEPTILLPNLKVTKKLTLNLNLEKKKKLGLGLVLGIVLSFDLVCTPLDKNIVGSFFLVVPVVPRSQFLWSDR